MIEQIKNIDKNLLLGINGNHSPIVDELMWQISHQLIWVPLYLFFIFYAYKHFTSKQLVFFLIGVGLCFLLADRISVLAFKDVFMRYRPTHNLNIKHLVHTYQINDDNYYQGGLYGFVSSHAANFFALSTYLFLNFKRYSKYWGVIFLWAILIGYSRIYLGVHYPSDVTVGGLLGIIIGYIVFKMITFINQKINNELA